MSKVAIVTDSTAYIPKKLVVEYGISVAPQILIWGDENYRDGVDIQPKEFYERLKSANTWATILRGVVISLRKYVTPLKILCVNCSGAVVPRSFK